MIRRGICAGLLVLLVLAALGSAPAQEPVESAGAPATDGSFYKAAMLDSIYRAWMAPDSLGERHYWFRRTFNIDERPSGGKIWITSDDNYSLFVNGTYIYEDRRDTMDWMMVDECDIGSYLRQGENCIAIAAFDVDGSRQGLLVGLVYETIPDIDKQLELMVQRELEAQEKAREEQLKAAEKPEVPATEEAGGLTPKQIEEIRTIEKNKLY